MYPIISHPQLIVRLVQLKWGLSYAIIEHAFLVLGLHEFCGSKGNDVVLNAFDVANYILNFVAEREDVGDIISNLKLQKLLYYSQGFYLAACGKPLFDEKIYHWLYGPVVREVYHQYSDYKNQHIPAPRNFDSGKYSADVIELLDEVCYTYGQYSAWALSELTHEEPPWANTKPNEEITHQMMQDFFTTQLLDGA